MGHENFAILLICKVYVVSTVMQGFVGFCGEMYIEYLNCTEPCCAEEIAFKTKKNIKELLFLILFIT